MMSRIDRAKQFVPFDAMKGLGEALRKREEMHCRAERRELDEEITDRNSAVLASLSPGDGVSVCYYDARAEKRIAGKVVAVDKACRVLRLDFARIPFDDIYSIAKQ